MSKGSKKQKIKHVHVNDYAKFSHANELQAQIQSGEWDRRIQKTRAEKGLYGHGGNLHYISALTIYEQRLAEPRSSLDYVSA